MFEPLADLERQARERPDAVAIATVSGRSTFAEVHTIVGLIEQQLGDLGLRAGQLVAVDLPAALEWIVDLALFRVGAVSVSIRGVSAVGDLRLDALLTQPHRRSAAAPLVLEIDDEWLAAAGRARRDLPDEQPFTDPGTVFRLLLTSGTTGIPRAAAYTVGALAYRMADGHAHWTDGRPELTMIGLSTTGGFHAALASLRLGVPWLAIDGINPQTVAFAAAQGIRVLCGSPYQVALFVHTAAEVGIEVPELEEVRLAGATPSDALLALLDERLGVPVRGVYGSTEGGGVSQLWYEPGGDRSNVGVPLPDVELEVVDGLVRYRSPGLVAGYLVEGAVQPLPGGWFVPGDTGRLEPDGSLTLTGRDSELLNIGGLKLDPATIDDLALGFPGVLDAAAFALERRAGLPEVGLAVVAGERCDLRALDRMLRERLPLGHPTGFWQVDEIPRTRLGKPMRVKLSELYG